MAFEQLERRECLAFCWAGVINGEHTWNGTNGNDILNGIWVGAGGTIWYQTNGECNLWSDTLLHSLDTGVAAPVAGGPAINIRLNGFDGNDTVDFWAGPAAPPGPSANMAGFPINSVAFLVFDGGDGADTFTGPDGAGAPSTGPVIWPVPGAGPNIVFLGGLGNDWLDNMDDPEYFDGGPGTDAAVVAAGPPTKGGGDDWLFGGPDSDTLQGGPGNDLISGGTGADSLGGGDGDDMINGDEDGDTINGNNGNDTINTGPGGLSNIEVAHGDNDDDVIYAGQAGGTTTLTGGAGNDRIEGSAFEDNIDGGDGTDAIAGYASNDTINGGDKADVLWSNAPSLGPDQPWRANGQGNPAWFDMDASGPDNDGDCDLEDGHPDLDGIPCNAPGGLVANDDSYGVSHTAVLNVAAPGILMNDTFGGPPTIQVIHTTLHGALTVNQDGSFSYDPDNSFVGKDSFVYNLSHGGATTAWPAVVTINVTNTAPVANNDGPKSVTYTQPMPAYQWQVINNAGSGTDFDADSDDIDIAFITQYPTKGTISVNLEDGLITYTYTGPNPGMSPVADTVKYKATDDWAVGNEATLSIVIFGTPGMPLMLDLPPGESTAADAPVITQADLAMLAGEAARRWVLAGVDPITARKALEGTEFVVADLPGSMLGLEAEGTIVIDVNGAGHGWFIDATPGSDEEFDVLVAPSERQASRGSVARGRVDLLTVFIHEFGHSLGMVHLEGEEFAHSVMNDTLGLSMRRTATAADILAADEFYARLWESGSTIRRRQW